MPKEGCCWRQLFVNLALSLLHLLSLKQVWHVMSKSVPSTDTLGGYITSKPTQLLPHDP